MRYICTCRELECSLLLASGRLLIRAAVPPTGYVYWLLLEEGRSLERLLMLQF